MKWNEIVGHSENINNLRAVLASGKVPHAQLFTGPEGVGKRMAAKVFAAALLCEEQSDEPCGHCRSCRQVRALSHPDLIIISPDGATIKIDQVRELQSKAALAPYYGNRRVGIIDAAETMTTQAANSLLKTLEEPVGNTVFILISSARQQLLDTIISRCRVVPFYTLPHDVLIRALVERGAESGQAEAAAKLSGGRMASATSFLHGEGFSVRDQAAEIAASIRQCEMQYVWQTGAVFEKLERRQALMMYHYIALILRDMVIYLTTHETGLLFNADISAQLAQNAHSWSEQGLTEGIRAVEQARQALAANANIRLTSEALLIKLRDAARED